MQISYSVLAMGTRQQLNRDFRAVNSATNRILADLGIQRMSTDPSGLSLGNLADAEEAAVNAGLSAANDMISSYQVADEALAGLKGTLESMREIVEDAALGNHTEEELAVMDAEYGTLPEQAKGVLEDTEFNGEKLLSGYDAVVTIDISAATDLSMAELPEGALAGLSKAIAAVGGARNELNASTVRVQNVIEGLQAQAEEVSSFQSRIATAESALAVLEALRSQLAANASAALSAQANASSRSASALLIGA